MIARDKGELYAECEFGEREYAGTLEFHEFIEDLKANGWRIRKSEGEWVHECPDCAAGDE